MDSLKRARARRAALKVRLAAIVRLEPDPLLCWLKKREARRAYYKAAGRAVYRLLLHQRARRCRHMTKRRVRRWRSRNAKTL